MATTTTKLPADWQGYIDDWMLAKGRSLSPRTVAVYLDSFTYLGRFLGPKVPALADLSKRDIAAYLDYTLKTTSATSTGIRFRGLSAVLGFLANPGEDDEPYLAKNPIKGLRPPKAEEQPVAVLSLDDARALLAACKGGSFDDRRDEAMIRFLFDTGCRRGEVASMEMGTALDLQNGRALVTGKTGPRWVAIGAATVAAIHRYMRMRRGRGHGDALWIGHKGALLGNGIYQLLARRFRAAGLDTAKRAHVFRHSFAHYFMAAGGGGPELVALAGWSGPAMIYRYGRSAAMERAHEAHGKFSPGQLLDTKTRRK
jgi:site-specific recombinase XerD